jgi:hypothetical protein
MAAIALASFASTANAQSARAATPPDGVRLYVLDCGLINVNRAGTERYNVTPEEVRETRFVVPCFLIAHPRGTLMWELGVAPDATVEARARGEAGDPTATSATVAPVTRTLRSQLEALGYSPESITYFAFSHAHVDHNANANLFADSTWLANPTERAFMWEAGNTRVNRNFFDAIERTKTVLLTDEHDVFGDGTVIIKFARIAHSLPRCRSQLAPRAGNETDAGVRPRQHRGDCQQSGASSGAAGAPGFDRRAPLGSCRCQAQ